MNAAASTSVHWPLRSAAPAAAPAFVRVAASAPARSFEQVFAEFAPYVGRTLRFLGVAEANIEDVCQEVFIVVHRRLGEVDAGGSLKAWVRQICVHAAQNERRRVRRRREDAGEPSERDVATRPTQHGSAEVREMRERLLVLLERLTEDQRAVFVLYEIEQLTMGEVAAAVKCPVQTAYSRLHAARACLEQSIAREEAAR